LGTWTEADAKEAENAIREALPEVLMNNRLGAGADFNTHEGKLPDEPPGGVWEYCWNLGCFWGYNPRNNQAELINTPEHYVETLVKTASLGGNYLLNIGPDPTGRFHPMAIDYLKKIGDWVNANGECIYGVSANPFPEKPVWGYATCRPGKIYLIGKDWEEEIAVTALKNETPLKAYHLNDHGKKKIPFVSDAGKWTLSLPQTKPVEPFSVIVIEVH
jgi:alpha-L-fucosidase